MGRVGGYASVRINTKSFLSSSKPISSFLPNHFSQPSNFQPQLFNMASRTVAPLRAASRQLRFVCQFERTFVSTTKSKPAPSSTTSRPPAFKSRPSTVAKSAPVAKPASPSTSSPVGAPGSHEPVPQVSGQPLPDVPLSAETDQSGTSIDWSSSFHGLGTATFGPEVATVLQAPLDADDIEVKPDGILYLPEIKYRRVLNSAFGPGGWGLAPRGDLQVQDRLVYRDYALIAHGR